MKNWGLQLAVIAVVIVIAAGGAYLLGNSDKASTVQVGTFYDGKEGYSISIPTGNTSTCLWNYTDGNAAIPYLETTTARSATEKHTIYSYTAWDWQVLCADDFGNYYVGTFPKPE